MVRCDGLFWIPKDSDKYYSTERISSLESTDKFWINFVDRHTALFLKDTNIFCGEHVYCLGDAQGIL